jgi:CheY-like chemotaxis protein
MTDLRAHDGDAAGRAPNGTDGAATAGEDGAATTLRPGAEPTATVAPAAPSVTGRAPAASDHDGALAGLSILVVDDDLGICQSMAELLRADGSEVAFATCAADALALISTRRFDLVVSDVVMPDMDGYDLYMELKATRPELPVILMTGYLYDRDHVIKRSKLAGLGGKVLFKKPIDPEKLKAIILERCAKEERHGGGSESGRNPALP